MIAKAIKGKGFRGAVAYDLQKGKSILLDSNMSAKEKGSVSAFAKEFEAIRALRPNLTKAVCHVSITCTLTNIFRTTTGAKLHTLG